MPIIMKLSELDALLNDVESGEKELRAFSSRMLSAIGAAYGRDSSEYEQAGGMRTSEVVRKRSASRKANQSALRESQVTSGEV